jgi:transposase
MPWQECSKMDERLKFVARLLDGEKMAALCREFDISRKTGYKIFTRYRDVGVQGLTDRSRRPYRQANRLPVQEKMARPERFELPTPWFVVGGGENLGHDEKRR